MQNNAGPPPPVTGLTATEAQNWMDNFLRYMALTVAPLSQRDRKKTLAAAFQPFLKHRSPIWEWYNGLAPAQQLDWDIIKALFDLRWQRPAANEPNAAERMAEFRKKVLARDELDERVTIEGTDDKRWRYIEYAEELERLGAKVDMPPHHLIPEALRLLPKGPAKLMREWETAHPNADFADWCAALRALSHDAIVYAQEHYDETEANASATASQAARLASLEAQLAQMRNQMLARPAAQRGCGSFWAPAPPYASREPSPGGRGMGLLQPVPIFERPALARRQTPTPGGQGPPASAAAQPAAPAPAQAHTPGGASGERPCWRCGQPITPTHRAWNCPNPVVGSPADVRERIMANMASSPRTPGPPAHRWAPPTPGTPSPAGRPRQVYSLEEQYADADDYDDGGPDDVLFAEMYLEDLAAEEGKGRETDN